MKKPVDTPSEILELATVVDFVRHSPERERRDVSSGDDVRAETRPPYLRERWVLPRRMQGALDTSVDREEGSARHAVLQTSPRCPPERGRAQRQPFVERTNAPPEREDLRAREVGPGPQLAAFFTSLAILASAAGVSSFNAQDVAHNSPSSRFAVSLKPIVAYLALNFALSWKKKTALPALLA